MNDKELRASYNNPSQEDFNEAVGKFFFTAFAVVVGTVVLFWLLIRWLVNL